MHINDLGLSVRALNCLLGANIATAEQLAKTSIADLLEIPNLGIISALEIGDALTSRGLKLPGYQPKPPAPGTGKPRRRVIETYYWECDVPMHRHISKSVAQRCINKLQLSKQPRVNKWNDEKYAECKALRESGRTLKEIAAIYGVSKERIRQVLVRWERKLHWRSLRA